MGNVVGLPTLPVSEINEVAAEVTKTFTPLYMKHYGLKLVDHMKEEKSAPPSPYRLASPPLPSEPLQMGPLTKLGAVRKNWKLRYFVAMNEADNYDIRYYADEAAYKKAPKSPKGSISLCGYKVERVSDEAGKASCGEFSIKLVPRWASDRRRAWYIRCADEANLKEWMATFEYAAWRASAPMNPDPVSRKAFQVALRETRWNLGEWGWYYSYQSEPEQLGTLVVDRCERGCMRPVYDKIPSGKLENTIRNKMVAALDSTVGAAVGAAWKSVSSSISTQAPTIKSSAEQSLGTIIEQQLRLQGGISTAIMGTLKPAVSTAASPLERVVSVFAAPMAASYKAAIDAWLTASAAFPGAAGTPAEEDLFRSWRNESYRSWGVLEGALNHIYAVTRYNPTTAPAGFTMQVPTEELLRLVDGVSMWEIERELVCGLRELCRAALYNYSARLAVAGPTAAQSVLAGVTADFIHDAKARVYSTMLWLTSTVILNGLRKTVMPSFKDALEPIKETVPSNLSTLIDVDEMAEAVVVDTVTKTLDLFLVPNVNSAFCPVLDATVATAFPTWGQPLAAFRGEPVPAYVAVPVAAAPAPVEAAPVVAAATEAAAVVVEAPAEAAPVAGAGALPAAPVEAPVAPVPAAAPAAATCPYGTGAVKEARADGFTVVQLPYGVAYLNAESVKVASAAAPAAPVAAPPAPAAPAAPATVKSPYGSGAVIKKREDGFTVVQLAFGVAYLNAATVA